MSVTSLGLCKDCRYFKTRINLNVVRWVYITTTTYFKDFSWVKISCFRMKKKPKSTTHKKDYCRNQNDSPREENENIQKTLFTALERCDSDIF